VSAVHDLLKLFLIFLLFKKVGYVEECVALQPDIDECRLHSRQYASNSTFVNGTRQRVFVFTLKINFGELFVFDHRHFGFVRGSGDK